MKAVRITGSLPRPLGAPPDWKEEDGHCAGLFIRPEVIEGIAFMRSAWESTELEAAHLLAGGCLILGVSGNRHPVIHMSIEAGEDFEPVVTCRGVALGDCTVGVRVEMLFSHEDCKQASINVGFDGRTYAEAVEFGIEKCVELARESGWVKPDWGKR